MQLDVKAKALDKVAPYASPEISATSQCPHPCTAFANSAARIFNKGRLSEGAQVQRATCNFTTASSVFVCIKLSTFFASEINRLFSPAKLNLFFRVLYKRPDGFHEIASLYQAISLGDDLHIILAEQDQLFCLSPGIPLNETNLERHVTGSHTRVSPLAAVSIRTAGPLNEKQSQVAPWLRQILRIPAPQNIITFHTFVKGVNEMIKRFF